jgi:hypothetical protein
MLLHRKHARRVIQLLADVLANPLELAAAGALDVVGFVLNHGTRKLRRQGNTLGLLAWFSLRSRRTQRLQLGFNGRDVGVEQVVEQAALLGTQLLTALGKLVTFEPGDFVGELLDDGLVAVVLLAHPVDLLSERINLGQQLRSESAQLVGGHLIEIGRGSHALDFTKADRLRQQAEALITASRAL